MVNAAGKIFAVEPEKANNKTLLTSQTARSSEFLFNRELSQIKFFSRVPDEGLDKSQPLLERLKFLSILSFNPDEFFMIRVSGLKEKSGFGISADGMTTGEQLIEISEEPFDSRLSFQSDSDVFRFDSLH